MKKFLRPVAFLTTAALFASCTSPYQAQMGALHNAYVRGDVSEYEYRQEMTRMQIGDAGWQQNQANAATTAALVGAVAIGAAAISHNNRHRHYRHYNYGHGHGHCW
jgi:hypothetical protein